MKTIKMVLVGIFTGIAIAISIIFGLRSKQSAEFEAKNEELKKKEEDAKKQVDEAKEKVDNVKVEDLKEEEVVDYWKKNLGDKK